MSRVGSAVIAAALLQASTVWATPRQPSLLETDDGKIAVALMGAGAVLNTAVGGYNIYTATQDTLSRGWKGAGIALGVLQLLFSTVVLAEGYVARLSTFQAPPEDLILPLVGALIGGGWLAGTLLLPVAEAKAAAVSVGLVPNGLGLSVAVRWR